MARAARDVVMGIGTIACSHLDGSESRQQDWKWGWDINSPPKPTQSGPTSSQTLPPAGTRYSNNEPVGDILGSNGNEPHDWFSSY